MPSYQTRCTSCGCETDELDQVFDQCPQCVLETEGQEMMRQDMSHQDVEDAVLMEEGRIMSEARAEAHDPDNFQEDTDADLVKDAIQMHNKLGEKLSEISDKRYVESMRFKKAHGALALVLADLYEDVK